MSESKKKKPLSSLFEEIKAIRKRRPTAAQIEELNKVLEPEKPSKDKRKIARPPDVES